MINTYNAAVAEIKRFHVLVADWLGNQQASISKETLLDRFPLDFTFFPPSRPMLTGELMHQTWADNVRGTRPGVKISVDQFQCIYQDKQLAIVKYVETQQYADTHRVLRSMAVLKRSADGQHMDWVSQHESLYDPS